MTEHRRAIGYVRQSEARAGEDTRTSLSLRGQEDAFRAWCAANDVIPAGVVADHDLQGDDPARPGLRTLLETVERERIPIVWVLSLSRFARDHILQELVWRDLRARGMESLVSDLESGIDDPFFRGIYGLLHAKTKAEISIHLRNAFARRAKDGGFPVGPAPVGYLRPHRITITRANGTRYDRETGEPEIDPEGAAFVRDLAARVIAGESLSAIAVSLNALGLGPRGGHWTPRRLRRILQNPIYAGDVDHHGTIVAHNDAWAILDRETWDRLQRRFGHLQIVRRTAPSSWLEGLIRHACSDGQSRHMYYRDYTGSKKGTGGTFACTGAAHACATLRQSLSARVAERAARACLLADLGSHRTPAEAVDIALAEIGGVDVRAKAAALDKQERQAQERWKRNHDRYSVGKLPWQVMDDEDALLERTLAAVRDERALMPSAPDEAAIIEAAESLTLFRDVIALAEADELRYLLAEVGVLTVWHDRVAITYREPYRHLVPATCIPVPKGGRGWRVSR